MKVLVIFILNLIKMDNKDIKILEAILFASGEPLDENDLKEKINDKNNISKHLQEIKAVSYTHLTLPTNVQV